jgi:hypothetical protein
MSYHQGPHDLRLAIAFEAEALISGFGDEAYPEARRRAQEASSDFLARDWSEVALMVAQKTGNRPSLLARMFH